ncbi:MAG: hypothetical protein H6739_00275 [Alphaproteobacteria bacterium]|nr:hypothetical protein [Alphaproteobacteria bacterium]
MIAVVLALVACRPPPPAGAPSATVPLVGQISLSVDRTAGRANLRIHSMNRAMRPPPAERQGVPLDTCRTVVPTSYAEGVVLAPRPVAARCGGTPLTLEEPATGVFQHSFDRLPPPGTRCEVDFDGVTIPLPPLPEAPDLRVTVAGLRWTPAGGDELRYVIPMTDLESTICRLSDDGEAPAPPGARTQLAFVTRHQLALVPLPEQDARVAVSVTAGVWHTPTQPR